MGYQRPPGKEIPLPLGKRWVISDIHGCFHTFIALLKKIKLKKEDQLFLLGDFINKGPSSLKVLEEIIHSDKNIFPLLGNHDQKLLDYYQQPSIEKKKELIQLNANELLELDQNSINLIASFISSLPYYYISGDFILVHAGFNFSLTNVFLDLEAMIKIKEFEYDPDKVFGKQIVHGHYPKSLSEIRKAVDQKKIVIPIDNGCIYRGQMKGVGNLIGLELNQMELLVQRNID